MDQHLFDPYIWLSLAALLFVLEMMIVPAIGLILMAAAALVMFALLMFTDLFTTIPMIVYSYIGLSCLFFVLFLKKFRRMYGCSGKEGHHYIGLEATVTQGPVGKETLGRIQVNNNGAEFSALLARNSALSDIDAGTLVTIISVRGHLAVVKTL